MGEPKAIVSPLPELNASDPEIVESNVCEELPGELSVSVKEKVPDRLLKSVRLPPNATKVPSGAVAAGTGTLVSLVPINNRTSIPLLHRTVDVLLPNVGAGLLRSKVPLVE
jgi:hypothetical protein